ncbi:hypothetical protein M0813_10702 [Anaeramoeba flamelloides]|uniref:Uncharacterized protein n=1 Tax=Anaeramoeba flamelloides TaxID=1746091 RepID=A0ABQ8X5H1_9EUKA|nr:hypothetical protein M0813_10702 [Anaeramoeba flamelloides]
MSVKIRLRQLENAKTQSVVLFDGNFARFEILTRKLKNQNTWFVGFFASFLGIPFHLYCKFIYPLIVNPIFESGGSRTAHFFLFPFRFLLSNLALAFLFLSNIILLAAFRNDYQSGAFVALSVVLPILTIYGLLFHQKFLSLKFLSKDSNSKDIASAILNSWADLFGVVGFFLSIASIFQIPFLINSLRNTDRRLKKCFENGFLVVMNLITIPIYLPLFFTGIRIPKIIHQTQEFSQYNKGSKDLIIYTESAFIRICWKNFVGLIFDVLPFFITLPVWITVYRIKSVKNDLEKKTKLDAISYLSVHLNTYCLSKATINF